MADARRLIVETALDLFGRRGIEATSLREVAREAGVSAALLVHHFGGKEGLVAAADEAAAGVFAEAYGEGAGAPQETLLLRARQTAHAMADHPEICAYVGRALVEETPGGARLFRLMIEGGRAEVGAMARSGALREDADLLWATLQHFFLIWAPLAFRAVLERHALDGKLLEEPELDRWVAANVALLDRGLYR